MFRLALAAGLVLSLLVFGVARAGAQPASGMVSGTVASHDGARLPLASLTLVADRTGMVVRAAADSLGAFAFDRLAPGSYTLTVEFPGFAPRALPGLEVTATGDVRVDVALEPLGVREVVTVSGALPRDSVEVTAVRESPARDVGELMAEQPGTWKLRKGGIANDVVVRGLQSRDLNVLIDGQRIYGACPNHMDPPAFHVDFSEVERVDVGKGPFDVRYQGSLGGVVNVVTRQPDAGWHATLTAGAGSWGYANPSLTASYGSERMSALVGASYRRSAPYTDGRGDRFTAYANYRADAVDSEAFRAGTAWGRASWRLAPGRQLEASYTRQQTDHLLYPYLQMDAMYDDADRVNVRYDGGALGRVSGVKAQAYWSQVDHWMTDAFRTSSTGMPRAWSMGTDASTMTAGGRVEALVGRVTVGMEGYRRNWNSETMMAGMAYATQFSIPDVDVDAVGAFAEWARPLGTRTAIDLGGRLDHVRSAADPAKASLVLYQVYHATTSTARSDVLPAGRVKMTQQLATGVELSASVGHTARVAEGNERYFALRRMGSDWVGNPGLAPTRNTGVDVALSLQRARLTVAGNVFLQAIDGFIAVYNAPRLAMVPGVMNTMARSYASIDARMRGGEVRGAFTLRSTLSLGGDVSYVRGTQTPRPEIGVTSTDQAEIPPLRGRVRLRWDDGRGFVELEGVASARQSRVDRSLGEAETPAYGVLNLHGGVRRGRVAVAVGVANLLDAFYVEHLSFQRDPFRTGARVAEPGRNVFTTASWRF